MKYLLYICFFLLIVVIFSYVNTIISKKESFTPKIRGFYRPIIRRTRLAAEGFYNNASTNTSTLIDTFLQKVGLV